MQQERYLWSPTAAGDVVVVPLREDDVLKQPGLVIRREFVPRLAATWALLSRVMARRRAATVAP